MKSYFLLKKDWGFTQAIEEINKRYRPGGISSGLARNVQIENWGVLVGRTRALAEINLAIEEEGSKTKLCKKIQISNSSMNDIIAFFKDLPDDSNKKKFNKEKYYQDISFLVYTVKEDMQWSGKLERMTKRLT